jgi:hypothetical protein
MDDSRIYDGHTFIFGMDAWTEPSAIPAVTAARAVNRIFRGGINLTRPGFIHKPFTCDDSTEDYEDVIYNGNFQGWAPYLAKRPNRYDGIVLAIAGKIFFMTLVNEKWTISLVFDGNDTKLMHTWFCQVEEWMYIQNGKDDAIFWDGQIPSTARRSDPNKNEMPMGTIMNFSHGRIFLSNAFDQIVASDILYGDSLTSTTNVQKFTENLYWAEGGYFGQPADLGKITGMCMVPRMDANLQGMGELVILSESGASAMDTSIPRSQWQDSRMQTVTMAGRGCVAPESVVLVNNDIWFRSDDGLASYELSRQEIRNKSSLTKLSREVNWWLDKDTLWLQRFTSSIYFNNRVLMTCNPVTELSKSEDYGTHRYFLGIVAVDLDKASGVSGDTSFYWDGLWTGIRPCGLIKFGKRAFAFSHDSDGNNRIYEISRDAPNDYIEGEFVKIKSFYMTKKFDFGGGGKKSVLDLGTTTEYEMKSLIGGEMDISDVRDVIKIGVEFRPDNVICWAPAMIEREYGSDFDDNFIFSQPRFRKFKFGTPANYCVPGLDTPINQGRKFQLRVNIQGHARVDDVRIAMPQRSNPLFAAPDCRPNDPMISLDCGMRNDYEYDIVTEWLNLVNDNEQYRERTVTPST